MRHQFRAGQTHEDVGANHGVGQFALAVIRDGEAFLRFVHLVVAVLVDHAFGIANGDVLTLHAQGYHQFQAGNGGCAGTGGDYAYAADILVHQAQRVQYCCGGHDGGTVLVVVEYRNIHALTALLLDVEAFRGFDVFQVDAAEGRLHRADDVYQLVWVVFVQLDVEHVNTGKLLEQYALAFHDRLAGQRADIAQAQYGGTVGDHGNQVAACGVFIGIQRVFHDSVARCGYARGVGKCQVALGGQRLGWGDLDLARLRELVEIECG